MIRFQCITFRRQRILLWEARARAQPGSGVSGSLCPGSGNSWHCGPRGQPRAEGRAAAGATFLRWWPQLDLLEPAPLLRPACLPVVSAWPLPRTLPSTGFRAEWRQDPLGGGREKQQAVAGVGGDSPQDQEKQEGGHEGSHRNAVTQVVDNKGDAVVQVILPLLDRQTHTGGQRHGAHGGWGWALLLWPPYVL